VILQSLTAAAVVRGRCGSLGLVAIDEAGGDGLLGLGQSI
jgi:hypothetical protein